MLKCRLDLFFMTISIGQDALKTILNVLISNENWSIIKSDIIINMNNLFSDGFVICI